MNNQQHHYREEAGLPSMTVCESAPLDLENLTAPQHLATCRRPRPGPSFSSWQEMPCRIWNRDLIAGKSDTLVKFLATMGQFHSYSFSNVMLICLQRPDATHVAGFNTWKKLGRYVMKGEKGIGIIAPMIFGAKNEYR